MRLLKDAVEAISVATEKGSILIVGTKGQAASLVENMALETGIFYVNKRWPGGLFTNFKVIKKSIDKLVEMEEILANGAQGMVKKEQLMMEREVDRLNKVYSGIKFMDRTPELVIVIDSKVEKIALKESNNSDVPVVALLDTNCDPTVVKFPIPANDDSLKSIKLFLDVFARAISGSSKSSALKTLRTDYVNRLEKIKEDFAYEIERKRAMEEGEKERIKALKVGLEVKKAPIRVKVDVKIDQLKKTDLKSTTKRKLVKKE